MLVSTLATTKRGKMFNLFKKKDEKARLQSKYEKLMSEAHRLSQTNRRLGDAKYKEADELMKQLESMQ